MPLFVCFYLFHNNAHLGSRCVSMQLCESDEDVEAALALLAAHNPEGSDLGAEWERVRPKKKPAPEVRTIDSFFAKKSSASAGKGTAPAAPEISPSAAGDKDPAVHAMPKAAPAVPTHESVPGTAPSSSKGDAFRIMMAAAKEKSPASTPSKGKLAPSGFGAPHSASISRHRFSSSPFLAALMSYISIPET